MERSSSMATTLIACATRSLVHNRTSTGTRSIACLRRPAIVASPVAFFAIGLRVHLQQHAIQGSLCPLKVPPGAISYLHDLGRNPGKVGLAPFHFSALPACGDCLRTGTRMFRAPACGTRPSQLALAFVIAHFARLAVVLLGNFRAGCL